MHKLHIIYPPVDQKEATGGAKLFSLSAIWIKDKSGKRAMGSGLSVTDGKRFIHGRLESVAPLIYSVGKELFVSLENTAVRVLSKGSASK